MAETSVIVRNSINCNRNNSIFSVLKDTTCIIEQIWTTHEGEKAMTVWEPECVCLCMCNGSHLTRSRVAVSP